MEGILLRSILARKCSTLELGVGGFLGAPALMAVHQGNNLGAQQGRRGPWSATMFPNSLLPAVGYGLGCNALPFLCLLWKIIFFSLVSTFCHWISNYFTNKLKTPMREVLTVIWLELHMGKWKCEGQM